MLYVNGTVQPPPRLYRLSYRRPEGERLPFNVAKVLICNSLLEAHVHIIIIILLKKADHHLICPFPHCIYLITVERLHYHNALHQTYPQRIISTLIKSFDSDFRGTIFQLPSLHSSVFDSFSTTQGKSCNRFVLLFHMAKIATVVCGTW